MKSCCVTVDLDAIDHYLRLYGFEPNSSHDPVYTVAVPRFLELFEQLGITATFFIVAQDVQHSSSSATAARAIVAAGHEVGNHTLTHRYDLSLLSAESIHSEIEQAHTVLREFYPVVGFRAPGYLLSSDILSSLEQLGYAYDSSCFPSPPYQMAKLAAIALTRLRGRTSSSIPGLRQAFCPASPLWVNRRLLEMPITVVPFVRLPLTGTFMTLYGEWCSRLLTRLMGICDTIVIEFHGVDLLELKGDRLPLQLWRQMDLRVPVSTKRRNFAQLLQDIGSRCRFTTLEAAAASLSPAKLSVGLVPLRRRLFEWTLS